MDRCGVKVDKEDCMKQKMVEKLGIFPLKSILTQASMKYTWTLKIHRSFMPHLIKEDAMFLPTLVEGRVPKCIDQPMEEHLGTR